LDWLGVNYYTRFVIKGKRNFLAKLFAKIPAVPEIVPNYGFGCQPKSQSAAGKPTSNMGWEIYPEGLLEALKAMAKFAKPLFITENRDSQRRRQHQTKIPRRPHYGFGKSHKRGEIRR